MSFSVGPALHQRRIFCIAFACLLPLAVPVVEASEKEQGLQRTRRSVDNAASELPTISFESVGSRNMARRNMEPMTVPTSNVVEHRAVYRPYSRRTSRDNNDVNGRRHFRNEQRYGAVLTRKANMNVNINHNENINVGRGGRPPRIIPRPHHLEDPPGNPPVNPPGSLPPTTEKSRIVYIPEKLTIKLHAAITFRENLIALFGYILSIPPDHQLNLNQYEALYLIHKALLHRRVYIFNILPILTKLKGASRTDQFKLIMVELAKNLPPHLKCAANLWVDDIAAKKIDIESLFKTPGSWSPGFLAGLDPDVVKICKNKLANEEMEPYDDISRIVGEVLGPVFVKIFHHLMKGKYSLNQQLFGIILANLPVGNVNPVLDENIKYIYEVTQESLIPNWELVINNLEYGSKPIVGVPAMFEPYKFVETVIWVLLDESSTQSVLKDILQYILEHLKPALPTSPNDSYKDISEINKNGLDVELLLSPIVPNHFSTEMVHLKMCLLNYLQNNELNIDNIRVGMNRYAYMKPIDLLISFLTRLQRRVPQSHQDILGTISALLSGLILKKDSYLFSPKVFRDTIGFLPLLWSFKNPFLEPAVHDKVNQLEDYLHNYPGPLHTLNEALQYETEHCAHPRPCLSNALFHLPENPLTDAIPDELLTLIVEFLKDAPPEPDADSGNPPEPPIQPPVADDTSEENDYPLTPVPMPAPKPSGIPKDEEEPTDVPSSVGPTDPLPTGPSDVLPPLPEDPGDQSPGLPPGLAINRPIYVVITNGIIQFTVEKPKGSDTTNQLPPIDNLIKPPNMNNLLDKSKGPLKAVFQHLNTVFGKNYLKLILPNFDIHKYPTNLSVLLDVLRQAMLHPKLKDYPDIENIIKKQLLCIHSLSATVLYPLIVKSTHLRPSNSIWIMIPNDHKEHTRITPEAPTNIPAGSLSFPFIHPINFLEPVDPENPFVDLLPWVQPDPIKPLRTLFSQKAKLLKLIGGQFNPLACPNRGMLLVTVLQILLQCPEVVSNVSLFNLVNEYLQTLQTFPGYIRVPEGSMAEVERQPSANWQPELVSLLQILPPPSNNLELNMMNVLRVLFTRQRLFHTLDLPMPSPSTSRGALLMLIINTIMKRQDLLDVQQMAALKYYQNKIPLTGFGALPIVWVWGQVFILRTEVKLGEVIDNVIDYDHLPYKERIAYNSLMTYLSGNTHILQGLTDFEFEKYRTQGSFLKALFEYLLSFSEISPTARQDIQTLMPYLQLTGPGAASMPGARVEQVPLKRSRYH